MKKVGVGLFLILAVAAARPAHAELLTLRAGAGLSGTNQGDFEHKLNDVSGGGISADELETYNVDLYVNLPVLPLGVGARYEWANQDDSSNGTEYGLDVNNLSLLVDWRIIDTGFYVGPILSIGYPWAELDFKNGGTGVSHSLDRDQLSYSGGLEAGVAFSRFVVGAEAGYKSIKFKSTDSSSVQANVDLSGFYGKVMVGLRFL